MKSPVAILTALGLTLFAAFAAWALYRSGMVGTGWRDLIPIWPYVLGGLILVGALTGGLMWLAFFSSRRGYDEPYDVDKPNGGRGR